MAALPKAVCFDPLWDGNEHLQRDFSSQVHAEPPCSLRQSLLMAGQETLRDVILFPPMHNWAEDW